jgi:LDH2 family malate/lactate/ureidoglycolate dehydrogenase
LAEGITVEDATWEKLVALAKEYGVADQLEMS